MKTTIDIATPLLKEAKKLARREGITLRVLVERALNRALRETREDKPFKLRAAAFAGKGLQSGFEDGTWEKVRDTIYEGRGG